MASIRCGNCKNTHKSVRAVQMCYETAKAIWQIPAAFGFMVDSYPDHEVLSMDEAVAHMDELAAQQRGEIWAEMAIERHLEGRYRMPDREEELERMAEACGLPVPPGFY